MVEIFDFDWLKVSLQTMGLTHKLPGFFLRRSSTATKTQNNANILKILDNNYVTDDFTNVAPKILSHVGRNLLNHEGHPLYLIKKRVIDYIYGRLVEFTSLTSSVVHLVISGGPEMYT